MRVVNFSPEEMIEFSKQLSIKIEDNNMNDFEIYCIKFDEGKQLFPMRFVETHDDSLAANIKAIRQEYQENNIENFLCDLAIPGMSLGVSLVNLKDLGEAMNFNTNTKGCFEYDDTYKSSHVRVKVSNLKDYLVEMMMRSKLRNTMEYEHFLRNVLKSNDKEEKVLEKLMNKTSFQKQMLKFNSTYDMDEVTAERFSKAYFSC